MTFPGSKPVVYVHTNDQQLLAAKVSAWALRSRSRHADAFEVRLLRLEETPHLYGREGQRYLWNGGVHVWERRDLQSFMALRRSVPQLMEFRGRALVLDPDVFAVGDVFALLGRDMGGKAILCRTREEIPRWVYTSSVMLLDCARLTHWQWDRDIDDIFSGRIDFGPWIGLLTEPAETIGLLEEEWNHFDTLNEHTKLLHNTEKSTQPWKTGLPIDFDLHIRRAEERRHQSVGARLLRAVGARRAGARVYVPHPDPRQERLFFSLLKECMDGGEITEEFVRDEIRRLHVRADALALVRAAGRP